MPATERATRINLNEFLREFQNILGPAKFFEYWSLLRNFLSFKLTKPELDELVPMTISKENVALHNRFIRAVYFNATCCNAPATPLFVNAQSLGSARKTNHDVKILDSTKTEQAKKIVGPGNVPSSNMADQQSQHRCPEKGKIIFTDPDLTDSSNAEETEFFRTPNESKNTLRRHVQEVDLQKDCSTTRSLVERTTTPVIKAPNSSSLPETILEPSFEPSPNGCDKRNMVHGNDSPSYAQVIRKHSPPMEPMEPSEQAVADTRENTKFEDICRILLAGRQGEVSKIGNPGASSKTVFSVCAILSKKLILAAAIATLSISLNNGSSSGGLMTLKYGEHREIPSNRPWVHRFPQPISEASILVVAICLHSSSDNLLQSLLTVQLSDLTTSFSFSDLEDGPRSKRMERVYRPSHTPRQRLPY